MSKEVEKNFEEHKFKAEISKVLDIVIHSLYTDKSIFIRELVSNASDALEKMRYLSLTEKDYNNKDLDLDIKIDFDEKDNKFIITDTGVGLTKEELKKNLGTIAHSGALEYISKAKTKEDLQLIGQFGVGFYSAFMVAEKVILNTLSYKKNSTAYKWESDGKTSFTISEGDKKERGTSIEIYLKKDFKKYTEEDTVKEIIKKHSSFISFPINVKEEKINTIEAIWTKTPSEVTDEQYNEFYKFVSNDFSDPEFKIHFKADVPLAIDALLFIPGMNIEKFGMRQDEDSEVGLYCKKILIEPKAKNILPKWMRFVKGVVDAADLPLNISRETLQDNTLITKIRNILVRKVIKTLEDVSKKDTEKFEKFYKEFSVFLKEGIVTDVNRKDQLSKLLRFESMNKKEMITIENYVENMKEDQKEIYFMTGTSYENIEASPYIEMFKKKEVDVLFAYEPVDDFLFQHLTEFDGKKLVSADSGKVEISEETNKEGLADVEALAKWIKDEVLKEKVKDVKLSTRLVDSPAMIVNENMSAGMQRFMEAMSKAQNMPSMPGMMGSNDLEINPDNNIIKKLCTLRMENEELAKELTEQIFDNANILAGLNTDYKTLVKRMNKIMEYTIK